MISSYALGIAQEADRHAINHDVRHTYLTLQTLTLADFCDLCENCPQQFQGLRAVLPRLPSAEIQRRWVGDSGRTLMDRSCNLIRLFDALSWRVTGQSLRSKTVLDYGCGWGRLLRLMYWAASHETVYGADPMEESLQICRECGITERLAVCDPVPTRSPFPGMQFDFMFSFSVFTHLPEHVAERLLTEARNWVSHRSTYVITVRSIEFWELRRKAWGDDRVDRLQQDHERDGYAHIPLTDPLYGDTTYSRDRLNALMQRCGWKIAAIDRDRSEPLQIAVALVPGS